MNIKVNVAIIGGGSAGLNVMGQARRAGKTFVLINGGELGTTCARIGCMPSKVFIQIADAYHARNQFSRFGIEGKESVSLDIEDAMEHVRDIRDLLVDRVLEGSTDELDDEQLIDGYAKFVDANTLEVNGQMIEADNIVIANGSRPIVPSVWEQFGDKILTSDSLFELESLPESIAVVGLGVIGLELGQALARMGVKVTGFDAVESISGLTDDAVNKAAITLIEKEFPMHLGQPADVTQIGNKLEITAGDISIEVDAVLACMGRIPNTDNLNLNVLNTELDDRGVPLFNEATMQIGDLSVYIAGDANGDRPILHEAGEEGRIAGLNASNDEVLSFIRKTPMAITFCDPNIITVGSAWADLKDDENVVVGEMPLGPLGRALIMGKNKGLVRIYARKTDGRLLGASMVSPKGENLAHLLAWAIQQQLTVHEALQMPFYHPVVEEIVQSALHRLLPQVEIKTDLPIDLRPA